MGYYQIRTSELDMDDREIIDKYHGLSRIENQFEELKGPLETRPVYVKTKEHIHAHLLICMIALTMIRLIQRKYMQKIHLLKMMQENGRMDYQGNVYREHCKMESNTDES